MQLDYLLFDLTDEESGACSFDAMASVRPARLPALLHEVEAVLRWAHGEFGAPRDDEGEWDYELQAVNGEDVPLEIRYNSGHIEVSMPHAPAGRVTATFTLTGSRAFGEAFISAFPPSE
jgi:hypothetical protein